jgi:hypothetical protein
MIKTLSNQKNAFDEISTCAHTRLPVAALSTSGDVSGARCDRANPCIADKQRDYWCVPGALTR